MTVKEFMRKMGISITVKSPEPRLSESYYKVMVEKNIKGYEKPQKVPVNDPRARGYTMTLSHPKTTKSVALPHFTAPGETEMPTGEDFLRFTVSAVNGGFPESQPVQSNSLVLKHWLGSDRYEELLGCEV